MSKDIKTQSSEQIFNNIFDDFNKDLLDTIQQSQNKYFPLDNQILLNYKSALNTGMTGKEGKNFYYPTDSNFYLLKFMEESSNSKSNKNNINEELLQNYIYIIINLLSDYKDYQYNLTKIQEYLLTIKDIFYNLVVKASYKPIIYDIENRIFYNYHIEYKSYNVIDYYTEFMKKCNSIIIELFKNETIYRFIKESYNNEIEIFTSGVNENIRELEFIGLLFTNRLSRDDDIKCKWSNMSKLPFYMDSSNSVIYDFLILISQCFSKLYDEYDELLNNINKSEHMKIYIKMIEDDVNANFDKYVTDDAKKWLAKFEKIDDINIKHFALHKFKQVLSIEPNNIFETLYLVNHIFCEPFVI